MFFKLRSYNLQVIIDEYQYISQFYVATMYQEEVDIVITSKPDFVTPEDFNNISEIIHQENKKAMQRMQKEFDEVIAEKTKKFLA
jgi:hypothetical protein